MEIINQITNAIIKNAKDGDTIRSLAERTGFAYSAIYKWIMVLKDYNVIRLVEKGNKNIIKINKNDIYKKFIGLGNAIMVVEKDRIFWDIIKKSKVKARFIQNTAIVIQSRGSYITGDFLDRVYFLEIYYKDLIPFKRILEKYNISYSENEIINKRPLIYVIPSKKEFKTEYKEGLPVIPLRELVKWCKKLYLDNILEQLDSIYNLKLKNKYSEIKTNI